MLYVITNHRALNIYSNRIDLSGRLFALELKAHLMAFYKLIVVKHCNSYKYNLRALVNRESSNQEYL